ncbi:MAG: hypothetical protein ACK4ZJ_19130, partial [Allorhizobium sp.]
MRYKEPLYKGGNVKDRIPGWCDRVQVHSMPSRAHQLTAEAYQPREGDVEEVYTPETAHNYRSVNDGLDLSDHSPVWATFELRDAGLAALLPPLPSSSPPPPPQQQQQQQQQQLEVAQQHAERPEQQLPLEQQLPPPPPPPPPLPQHDAAHEEDGTEAGSVASAEDGAEDGAEAGAEAGAADGAEAGAVD